ncbi:EAL domain, c-di-GMP-specific phosphodiesterase class I (or its enzymatically inactive variant) [Psychrobacillus sp. OK028]|uniref:putative bifunctional diguanylate cyclase/phosphodiesterase n=1 Tax=Psychrobacillus sp. OK028 TaxID=1884359 RepID=UPI00088D6DC0|nr:EAL domain-containing protein [Psychrobacillus sp. OK028]SDM39700.1 EAL domain, c-di-GMP-specific phosphodiesterase class I (or its enzymatically inactive variant) [Psychrobacillus sp. OK028]
MQTKAELKAQQTLQNQHSSDSNSTHNDGYNSKNAPNQVLVPTVTVLEADLVHAIERNEFVLYYQPKVDAKSNQIIGAEALIRWNHPKFGLILPNDFIPLAEKTGFINQIGKWVKYTACKQNKAWQDAELPAIPVSINLSASRFLENDLICSIMETLKETQLDPRYFEIEITETSILENETVVFSMLDQLRKLGIKIALDDFGTGYASLSNLQLFHDKIDILKIDRSFIKNLRNPKNDEANFIVHMIIQLSNHLNLNIVAEGVETKEQLEVLQSYNCDTVQGYLYSKPVPASEFAELLSKRKIDIA